jgi:hypothetical protein
VERDHGSCRTEVSKVTVHAGNKNWGKEGHGSNRRRVELPQEGASQTKPPQEVSTRGRDTTVNPQRVELTIAKNVKG